MPPFDKLRVNGHRYPFGLSLAKPTPPFDKLRANGYRYPFGLSLSKPMPPFDELRVNGHRYPFGLSPNGGSKWFPAKVLRHPICRKLCLILRLVSGKIDVFQLVPETS